MTVREWAASGCKKKRRSKMKIKIRKRIKSKSKIRSRTGQCRVAGLTLILALNPLPNLTLTPNPSLLGALPIPAQSFGK
jgi:hypothetical protein